MPRSAIKSIQVLPLLTSGAAAAFDVDDDELALACSSHGAEDLHLTKVTAWLDRLGLDENSLECGATPPLTPAAAAALAVSGRAPTRIHNCCSGKHSGFLTQIQHHDDWGVSGYLAPDHPVQIAVRDSQAAVTGIDLSAQPPVVDGCGIPVYQFPLDTLALAMARLVTPGALPEPLATAAARVAEVLPSRPFLVSGTGRAEVVLGAGAQEPLILKGGAEGVMMGALPTRQLGFALKAEDGSRRAVDEAVAALLLRLDVLAASHTVHGPVRNAAGLPVGDFRVLVP